KEAISCAPISSRMTPPSCGATTCSWWRSRRRSRTLKIDPRDREQPLDRRIIISCLCDLRVENPQILAQPIELAQVPLDGGALVIGYELLRQPDLAQPSEQVGMRARRDHMGVQDRVHLVLDPRPVPDNLVAACHQSAPALGIRIRQPAFR